MGILDDAQFDLSSYGGSPSGWLGALLRPQSSPAPGFAPDATQMPPSFAPTSSGIPPTAAAGMAKGAVTPQIGADAMGKDPGVSGVAPQFAQVAALNPDILKTVVAAHFDALPSQKTGTPRANASGAAAPRSSITGRAEVEAVGSHATTDTGQDDSFADPASPTIAGGLPVSRAARPDLANQLDRPLDARLANLRRLLLSGPAVLPRVRTPPPLR